MTEEKQMEQGKALSQPRAGDSERNSARPWFVLRILGFLAFVAYLVWNEHILVSILDQLRDLDPVAWFAAVLINLIPPLVVACRLKLFLRAAGTSIPYRVLASDSLRSMALNTVSVMGAGDLYRLNRLHGLGVPLVRGSALVVMDRLCGVAALFSIAVGIQVLGLGRSVATIHANPTHGRWLAIAVSIGVAAGLALVAIPAVRRGMVAFGRARIRSAALTLGSSADGFILLSQVGLLSIVSVLAWVSAVGVLGAGLGLSLPTIAYLDAATLVALATLIPITIGGVGLREAGYVVLLAPYGVLSTSGIALGLAQYSTLLGAAAIGGSLFLIRRAPEEPLSPESQTL